MRYIRLGKTELTVSEIGFGGIPIIRSDSSEAVRTVRAAFDSGITFFDTANSYQDSESKLGEALAGIRDKTVIATKTTRRDGKGAIEHLDNSLRMLRTDYIDLYQLHQISQEKEWEAAISPGGVLQAIKKAQKDGKIRHIGVTSHNAQMAAKLIRTGHFSTIQFPFNFIEQVAEEELFPLARNLDLGIIVMKPFAGGILNNASLVFKYLRQFPGIVPIPGLHSTAEISEILDIYREPNTVTAADMAAMDDYRQRLGKTFCRRCEYCMPCPNNVSITPIMLYTVITGRMSKKVAVDFAKTGMDTAPNCTKCAECLSRCPYELPIPEMVEKHYEIYQKDLKDLQCL